MSQEKENFPQGDTGGMKEDFNCIGKGTDVTQRLSFLVVGKEHWTGRQEKLCPAGFDGQVT